MGMFLFISSIVLILIGTGLQSYLKRSFEIANQYILSGTGADLLNELKEEYNMESLEIHPVDGFLTDHFMPSTNSIGLSNESYYGNGIGSIAVALHEFGHALQHKDRIGLAKFHSALFPIMKIASTGSIILGLIGILLNLGSLYLVGIIAFSIVVLYYISLTFLEYDASRRGYEIVKSKFNLSEDESKQFKKVLTCAFLTYFLSLLQAIIQLANMIFQYKQMNNRN